MSYHVRWDSGSLRAGTHRFHGKKYATRQRALTVGARASRMTKGYVIIERGGFEIAECYKGKCKIWGSTPMSQR